MADEKLVERTIDVVFYSTNTGETYDFGEDVLLTEEEAARGDALGAFKGQRTARPGVDMEILPADKRPAGNPGDPGGDPSLGVVGDDDDGTGADPLTDEEIEALSGDDLDAAATQAGIDATTGGSLQGGALSADEKRHALREARDSD